MTIAKNRKTIGLAKEGDHDDHQYEDEQEDGQKKMMTMTITMNVSKKVQSQ
jgi:hypothetical protein